MCNVFVDECVQRFCHSFTSVLLSVSLYAAVHAGTLLANLVGCLAWFFVDVSRGMDFGLSILWFLLFTPCSFVCWYRPLYGAFRYGSDAPERAAPPLCCWCAVFFFFFSVCRSDSSFRFFLFFFVYICQFGIYVIQCIGITSWGTRWGAGSELDLASVSRCDSCESCWTRVSVWLKWEFSRLQC